MQKDSRARLSLNGQSGASQEQGQLNAKGERSWSYSDTVGLLVSRFLYWHLNKKGLLLHDLSSFAMKIGPYDIFPNMFSDAFFLASTLKVQNNK